MYNAYNEKWKKSIDETIELLNQERIRTLGEKENHKHLEILEVDRNLKGGTWTDGQSTRKLMTMHQVLHSRGDKDKLCVSRKQRRRWLANVEHCIDASLQGFEDYVKKNKESLSPAINYILSDISIHTKTKKQKH